MASGAWRRCLHFRPDRAGGRATVICNGTRVRVKLVGRRRSTAVSVVALCDGKRISQVVRRR
jgi:hypothetical protein